MAKRITKTGFLLFIILVMRMSPVSADGAIPCQSKPDCERVFQGLGTSECISGGCTNPFHQGGCLANMMKDSWKTIRVCHSEDPPEALEQGHCRLPPLNYNEARVLLNGWDSTVMGSWLMQILLSELLDVPSTIEAGSRQTVTDFYDIRSRLDAAEGSVDAEVLAFETAFEAENGECINVNTNDGEQNSYAPCAHISPEVWQERQGRLSPLVRSGVIEPFSELGALAYQTWQLPKFVLEKDPTLASYIGLQGEENRKKLAETFLTPTTFKEYCDLVSSTQCQVSDSTAVAGRGPTTPEEEDALFIKDLYTGHFRQRPEQNCTLYPDTCYGVIGDYPCSWASMLDQQTYWLNISLKSTPLSYNQMVQLWDAANWTQSNMVSLWWSPDSNYQRWLGTPSEMTGIRLPPTTQECLDTRDNYPDRCKPGAVNFDKNTFGGCDYASQTLKKVLSSQLQKWARNSDLQEELWSPAYEAARNFQLSDLHMGTITNNRKEFDTGDPNMDFRLATCKFVADNLELFQEFVPASYPRVTEESLNSDKTLFKVAMVLGIFAAVAAIGCMLFTIRRRRTKIIYYLRPEFMFCVEMGALCLAGAAVLLSISPSESTCVSIPWFYNLGYSMLLLPLLIRVNTIHRVLSKSNNSMKRVKVGKRNLLWVMFGAVAAVAVYVLIWVLFDTPEVSEEYDMSSGMNENGATIVQVRYYCSSDSSLWFGLSIVWQVAVLFLGTVVAFIVTRGVNGDINDTRIMTLLLLILLVFGFLRLALHLLRDSFDPVDLQAIISYVLTTETLATLLLFIIPKLIEKSEIKEEAEEALPDLFPRTTIMYCDISGFAGWCSVRSPLQVFKFLESIYGELDKMAEKRNVMKVETVGETYVAVTGIPRDKADRHAIAMARFAMDIMEAMHQHAHLLVGEYGPDTADLSLRIGLHSGAVTGGYLKGKGARFQLFGDNAGIARQVCLTGERGRIHISEKTAMLLRNEGKEHWLEKRLDLVAIKGHAEKQTFWLRQDSSRASTTARSQSIVTDDKDVARLKEIAHAGRLIDWNVEVLHKLLKQIEARRIAADIAVAPFTITSPRQRRAKSMSLSVHSANGYSESTTESLDLMPLDEVVEIIGLPPFDAKVAKKQKEWESITVPEPVLQQLRTFVSAIADLYKDNPFHNFAHASHVVMSSLKYMARIVAPSDLEIEDNEAHIKSKAAAALHDHTYGITSDPLTQFACVLSALIHDVDHPGVPNGQLIQENPGMAHLYKDRSVAEQNSFDISWKLLMSSDLDDLRSYLCTDNDGLMRLRQIVINGVMATDLGDKELKKLRNDRWSKAFSQPAEGAPSPEATTADVNRKATIVIEHLIQAADVSHTMQHWDIYREWNAKLFEEMYIAFREGRSESNPADNWYEGELGFYDFYIIPLSKKLSECGVFGVSSDENLNYAKLNRELWVSLGKAATEEMLERCEKEWESKLAKEIDNQVDVFTEEDMI